VINAPKIKIPLTIISDTYYNIHEANSRCALYKLDIISAYRKTFAHKGWLTADM